MSEPEIARRCRNCGASIRDVALFCPQCGNAQPHPQTRAAEPAPDTTSKNTAPLEDPDVAEPRLSMSDTVVIERPAETPQAPASPRTMSDTVAIERPEALPEAPPKASPGPGVRGVVGARVQRATTLARDVEGDVIHRVQKVREISNVVLDEAGYDPGLRFVLAAVIVFVLFLVILLLNKLIT